MSGWDWNAVYLTCFGVGLVLSLVAFFAGGLHLHMGHFRFGGHGGHIVKDGLKGHVKGHGVSPLNGFTIVAFLCWFGGAGYLLHRGNVFGFGLVLLFAALSGIAGASLVFWFLAYVLMPGERTLEASDTEMTGVIGTLSCAGAAAWRGRVVVLAERGPAERFGAER